MASLLGIVFSVTGAIAAFTTATLLLWTRKHVKGSRRALAGVALFYCAASTYYVPHVVANAWTAGYHPFRPDDVPAGPVAIVVLGSGVEVINGWHRTADRLTPLGMARMLEAYRVYQLVNSSATIISTGGHSPTDPGPPSSETMRNTLIAMGVPADRILQESASRTTHDEARFVVPLLRRAKLSTVVLVTSDIHMRRSAGAFRAEGVHVTPAIAPDPLSRINTRYWMWPTEAGLEFSGRLTRELLGLPYYWIRGWWSRA